jgi:hypothetical protein
MRVVIGSQYKKTKAMLREKIRERTISALETKAENHACYFCGEHIEGKMWVLTEKDIINGKETESVYFIDCICYQGAKLSPEYEGIRFSLN